MKAPVQRLGKAGLLMVALPLLGCADPSPCGREVWRTSQWLGQGVVVRCTAWQPLPHCRRGRVYEGEVLAWSCWASVNESEQTTTFQVSED